MDPARHAHAGLGLVATALLALVVGGTAADVRVAPDDGLVGHAPSATSSPAAAVEAFFARRSYARGQVAHLMLRGAGDAMRLQIMRAGLAARGAPLPGLPVTHTRVVPPGARKVAFRVAAWPSGLYFARLTSGSGRVGYAPFVLRPRRLGEHRVAIVLPTSTWQAYNFRDDDGDGVGDTWYADRSRRTIRLDRPYLDGGIPPHYRHYDAGFLRWLVLRGHRADFLAQEDVEATSGAALARAYALVVFPGHHEYTTAREYDAVERFRDLGGNLAFLSANNFFWRVDRRRETLTRIAQWRALGRPESRLIGVQYVDWYEGKWRNRPFRVVGASVAPWLFRGTGLHDGRRFGNFGIEIDARTGSSPRRTRVLAVIQHVFGRGKSAEMTYYVTSGGAKVFAAGAFTLGGAALFPPVSELLENLWVHLSRP